MNILILEDSEYRVNIFIKKLKQHTLHITDKSKQAIEYLNNNEYQYIFLDHDLGDLQNQWNDQDCGMVVVDYLCSLQPDNIHMNSFIVVHSFNTPRGAQMTKRLKDFGYKVQYVPGVWE